MDNNIPQDTNASSLQNLPPTVPIKPDLSLMKIPLIIGLVIFILVVGSGSFILGQNSVKPAIPIIPTITQIAQKACTLEAKICPDGSSVGRTGPNCEFAPCPSSVPILITSSIVPSQIICPTVADWCPDGNRKLRVPPTCEIVVCPTLTPFPKTNITPVVANDNLDIWKTYNGTKPLLQKIEFKYPDNWFLWDYDNQVWAENLPHEQYNNPDEVYTGGIESIRIKGSQFSIAVQENLEHRSLDDFTKIQFTGGCDRNNYTKTVLNDNPALLSIPDHSQCKNNMYKMVVAKGDYYYIIMYDSADNQLKILEKILSTVKFI